MIKNHTDIVKPEIDLNGPDGNAFILLGYAKQLCKELDLDYTEVQAAMTYSDYENLINTFDSYFGDYVDLVR